MPSRRGASTAPCHWWRCRTVRGLAMPDRRESASLPPLTDLRMRKRVSRGLTPEGAAKAKGAVPLEGLECESARFDSFIQQQLPRNYAGFGESDRIAKHVKTASFRWDAGKLRAKNPGFPRLDRAFARTVLPADVIAAMSEHIDNLWMHALSEVRNCLKTRWGSYNASKARADCRDAAISGRPTDRMTPGQPRVQWPAREAAVREPERRPHDRSPRRQDRRRGHDSSFASPC